MMKCASHTDKSGRHVLFSVAEGIPKTVRLPTFNFHSSEYLFRPIIIGIKIFETFKFQQI